MREQMLKSQLQQEHAKSSRFHSGPLSERGGRLYDTALSIMVLETYYRYPSVYKSRTDD